MSGSAFLPWMNRESWWQRSHSPFQRVRFYDARGNVMGVFSGFDQETPPTVTDPNGNAAAWNFHLDPRHQVKFVFKGFFVFGIELVGWGDIEQGEVTPM